MIKELKPVLWAVLASGALILSGCAPAPAPLTSDGASVSSSPSASVDAGSDADSDSDSSDSGSSTLAASTAKACKQLFGILPELAQNLSDMQNDPANVDEYVDYATRNIEDIQNVQSDNDTLNDDKEQYVYSMTQFVEALQDAIHRGSDVNDPAVTPVQDRARAAGQALDAICN